MLNIFRTGLLFSWEEKRSSITILQDLYYLKHIHPEIYNAHECFAQTVSKIQANLAEGSIDRNKQGFNDQIIKEALEAANIKYEQSF